MAIKLNKNLPRDAADIKFFAPVQESDGEPKLVRARNVVGDYADLGIMGQMVGSDGVTPLFPNAAALTDAEGNTNVSKIAAYNMLWDTAKWIRDKAVLDHTSNLFPLGATALAAVSAANDFRALYTALAVGDGNTGNRSLSIGSILFNGTNYDRWREGSVVADVAGNVGMGAVVPYMGDGTSARRMAPISVQGDAATAVNALGVGEMLFNGTNFDRKRNNLEGTLMASAARTAAATTAVLTNYNHRGVLLVLDVTSPGTGTMSVLIRRQNFTTGLETDSVVLYKPIINAFTGSIVMVVYPGLVDSGSVTGSVVGTPGLSPIVSGATVHMNGVIPRRWLIRVYKSDASSWTYSLDHAMLL